MNRRKFIWLAGGGTIAAATAATVANSGALTGAFPAGAVQAWDGPVGETEPRRRAVAYAITAPNPHNLQPWMSQALQEFAEMRPHYEQAHQLMLGHGAPRSAQDDTLQMFCRLGYPAAPAPATPRRALAHFVAV